jgi:hypothetical protein
MSLATQLEPGITSLLRIGKPLLKQHGHQMALLRKRCACLQKILEERMRRDPYKDYIGVLETIEVSYLAPLLSS